MGRNNKIRSHKSGASHLGLPLTALVSLLCFVFFPAAASAATLHTPTAFSPIDGSGIGATFRFPRGIGVDESTGNVFVTSGHLDNVVDILGAEGGAPAGVKSPFHIAGFDFEAESPQIAYDNSPSSPNKGTLYVSDPRNDAVKKFTLNVGSQEYVAAGELAPVPPFGGLLEGAPQGVAIDDAGDVYVSVPRELGGEGSIIKFNPAGAQVARIKVIPSPAEQEKSVSPLHADPGTLAVDSAGDVFVEAYSGRLFKYPANGSGEIEEGNFSEIRVPAQVGGLAIDRASNTVYAATAAGVSEIDAGSGLEKGTFAQALLDGGNGGDGIGLSHSGGLIYFPIREYSGAFQFEKLAAFNLNGAIVPDVATEAPLPLKATKATLRGSVGPDGLEVSECKFEYGLTRSLGSSAPCEGAIPTDSSRHPVAAEISGLTPEAAEGNNGSFFYRVVAKNANGTSTSAIYQGRTKPIVEGTAITALGTEGATLNGVLRPEGGSFSDCKVEYALKENFEVSGEYEESLPCSPAAGAIPSDFEPHAVSATVGGLLVGTAYVYRLATTGSLGPVDSPGHFNTVGPSVDAKSVPVLGETSATLEALVNPHGKATTYHFEYGSQGPCASNPCTSAPIPDASAGSANANQPTCSKSNEENSGCIPDARVSQSIKGLTPGTTYHYRVAVSNADGAGHSAESTFATYAVPPSFGACPNDGFRLGHPSARLPDCRAYERVTPAEKKGNPAGSQLFKTQASISGDGVTSQTGGGLPGGEGAQNFPIYLSQRGAGGWSTQGLLPPPAYGEEARVLGWTPDLAYSLSVAIQAGSDFAGSELDSALLVRSSATHAIQQVTPYVDGARYAFVGASADDSKLFFEASGPSVNLTGNAPTGQYKYGLYLYEPATDELSLVGILPASQGGFPAPGGAYAGSYGWWNTTSTAKGGGALGPFESIEASLGYLTQDMHAISSDGTKAFWTAGGTGQVYVREGLGSGEPETAQVSASQRATPDPNGQKPAIFMAATPSGSVAFFTSCQKLTDDSTAHSDGEGTCQHESQGQDLYAYDTESRLLRDLTVDHAAGDPQGAEVEGVLGTSDDGSYVYFVANGDLDGAGPAQRGNCQGGDGAGGTGASSFGGSCSLYVWHDDSTTFVARLDASKGEPSDSYDWQPGGSKAEYTSKPSRVSADGQAIVFRSQSQQTGYDTRARGGQCMVQQLPRCSQFYRYHVGQPGLDCVTCVPTGIPPTHPPTLSTLSPGGITNFYHPSTKRFVSASGNQVFFESGDKLSGADTNGDEGCPTITWMGPPVTRCQDVYEWEAPGAGSCSEASPAYSSQNGGCLYLLSSGTSPYPSFLGDASASGNDAFIFTLDQLVPGDEDQIFDLYDASVDGGLASQNQPPPPPPCEAGACKGAAGPAPSTASPGTAAFQGPGNPQAKHPKKHKKRHHKPKHKKHHDAKQGGRK